MQIWVNDDLVATRPSFANNEGHVAFEAGRQSCEITVTLAKSGTNDCKKLGSAMARNDLEKGSSQCGKRKPKLIYRLYVEGVSLGLPDSVEALVKRAQSAIETRLPNAADPQSQSLLKVDESDAKKEAVDEHFQAKPNKRVVRTHRSVGALQSLVTPRPAPIKTFPGDPRGGDYNDHDDDDLMLTNDLQSLLLA